MKDITFKPLSKADFKKYMKQGLGRCALCLEEADNVDKYKEIVLFGCLHNLSYDMQCEGTSIFYDQNDYLLLRFATFRTGQIRS